jgi:hypothetical protein
MSDAIWKALIKRSNLRFSKDSYWYQYGVFQKTKITQRAKSRLAQLGVPEEEVRRWVTGYGWTTGRRLIHSFGSQKNVAFSLHIEINAHPRYKGHFTVTIVNVYQDWL